MWSYYAALWPNSVDAKVGLSLEQLRRGLHYAAVFAAHYPVYLRRSRWPRLWRWKSAGPHERLLLRAAALFALFPVAVGRRLDARLPPVPSADRDRRGPGSLRAGWGRGVDLAADPRARCGGRARGVVLRSQSRRHAFATRMSSSRPSGRSCTPASASASGCGRTSRATACSRPTRLAASPTTRSFASST